MTDLIEFDPVDDIGAGAFGQPGERTFVIQARKGSAVLSVLVEKEQVALLAAEAEQFLDRIADEDPEEPADARSRSSAARSSEDEPLFRARLIGIGYDPERALVLIELREDAADEDDGAAAAARREPKATSRGSTRRARRSGRWSRNGVAAVDGGPAQVPAVRLPDGSRRAHLPAAGTDGRRAVRRLARRIAARATCCATATSTCSAACRGRRTRRSS